MKKLICFAIAIALLALSSGCANGPIRSWFKGAPCSLCNPAAGQLPRGLNSNSVTGCDSGVCGSGVVGQPLPSQDGFAPNMGIAPDQGLMPQSGINGGMIGSPLVEVPGGPAPSYQPDGIPVFSGQDITPVGPTTQYNYGLPTTTGYGGSAGGEVYGMDPGAIVTPPNFGRN